MEMLSIGCCSDVVVVANNRRLVVSLLMTLDCQRSCGWSCHLFLMGRRI